MNPLNGRVFVLVFALIWLGAGHASAQETPKAVHTAPKGTIGLGLVGAELGLAIPAALRVKNPFVLTATGVVGAAGGALAGFYLLDKNENKTTRAISISMLALGIAGVIPTTLLVVRASRYVPPDDAGDEAALRDAGGGLLRVSRGRVGLGIPALTVSRASFDRSVRETQLSLLSGRF